MKEVQPVKVELVNCRIGSLEILNFRKAHALPR